MLEPVFTPEQIAMLNTPLNPSEIEQKQGMSYLKGQLAVVKANNIFGYGNWGYQLASGVEVIDTETKNRNDNVIYRVRVAVTLTVRGCMPITELGDCEAQGTGPAAMSMAEKGAVTDGLKRCLKNFGPCFGLDLYFKTPPAQTSSQPTTQPQRQQAPTQATSRQL
jgi:recombination DNA repair RAD52 pathway protein